jgi:hypothetical protein
MKPLRFCAASATIQPRPCHGKPRQATAFSRLVLGTASDVKPLTLSNVAFGVKLRRTQCEHMFSGLPLIADIDFWHLRDAAKCQVAQWASCPRTPFGTKVQG